MASARYAWGIDVGNRALKAIKLVRDATGQLKVDDFEVIEHETVLSQAGDNRDSLIQSALAQFVQRHPIKSGGVCAVSVSGQSSFARFIKLPPVEAKKIPEIVRFEAIQQIPFPLDDVEWTYQLFQEKDSPEVEVGIFAMRKELVNQQIKFYTDIDLNVQVVQMNPLAVYNAMQYDQRIAGTTMIIDLGAENTDLIIAEGETIWLRSIPIGGNNFTETLTKAFKLDFTKAEDLKRNASTSKYARQIFQAMRPVFADLVAEIQRSIGFYARVHRDSRIKNVVALGGTFRLPGLQKYLQQNLQLDVKRLDGLIAGAPSDAKMAATFNENLLSVVSAYGLAVQAMGEAKIVSSLLPEHIRRARMWQEKTKWFAAAAAMVVVGSGIMAGRAYFDNFAFEQGEPNRQRTKQVLSRAQELDGKWSDIQTRGGADRQLIKNIASMKDYRLTWASLISDIHSSLPVPQLNEATLPRAQRTEIVLDTIMPLFVPDLTQALTVPVPGLPGAVDPGATAVDPTTVKRGFVFSVTCTTPNARGSAHLDDTFLAALRSLTESTPHAQRAKYYVARATILSAIKLKENAPRQAQLRQAHSARTTATGVNAPALPAPGGFGARTGLPGAANRPPIFGGARPVFPGAGATDAATLDAEAFKDPSNQEPMLEDWELKIEFVIALDPAPPPPATPGDPVAAVVP